MKKKVSQASAVFPKGNILKGHSRRFNLYKCQLKGCCNFITTLAMRRYYCKNHMGADRSLLCRFKKYAPKRITNQFLQ